MWKNIVMLDKEDHLRDHSLSADLVITCFYLWFYKAINFCKREFVAIEIYGNNTLGGKSIIHAEIKTADSVLIGPMNCHISTVNFSCPISFPLYFLQLLYCIE